MNTDKPTFESSVQRFVDDLKDCIPDQSVAVSYAASEKKLPSETRFHGVLDTSLRDQGIVYVRMEERGGYSVALSVRRFPALSAAKNKAIIEFSVDIIGAVCDVSIRSAQ
jgi:hypothetical protein